MDSLFLTQLSHPDPLQQILAAAFLIQEAEKPFTCPNCGTRVAKKVECPYCGYNWRLDRMATVGRERSTGEVK